MAKQKGESKVRTAIKEELYKKYSPHIFIQVNHNKDMYGMKGLPDLSGHYKGVAFWLEVKLPNNKASKTNDWQKERIKQIKRSGGVAYVVRSPAAAIKVIEKIRKDWDL